jgi:hypothetical protein
VKKGEMGRACSMHVGEEGMHAGFWWESQKERDHYYDLALCGRIVS